MSVYRRGDVWHYDFTIGAERFRGSTKQRGKAAALKVESRQRERVALGEVSRPVLTLREATTRWFTARIEGRRSAATTAFRVEIMLRMMDGAQPVTEIDTPDIEDAMQRRRLEPTRQKKLPTNGTVNRDLIDSTLRPILRYCKRVLKLAVQEIDWGELRLSEPKGRSRTFTHAEMTAWRSALPEGYRPVFDFIAAYGVRLGEAFFPLDNFDAATGIIVLRKRKNGLPHTVRLLPDEARDLAARLGRAREAGLDTVWFRDAQDGGLEALTRRGFQYASRRALEAACVADARAVHDLRHHAATALLRLPGATLADVQVFLGHEHAASTARYAHSSPDHVFEIRRRALATTEPDDETKDSEINTLGPARTGT